MKFRDCGFSILCVLICASALYVVANLCLPSIKDENEFEEFLEDVIEEEIGVQVDLTPSTPEHP